MKKTVFIFLLILSLSGSLQAGKYPYGGGFKQLSPSRDLWYFVDPAWDIPAPDKWQHFYGTAVMQMIGSRFIGKGEAIMILSVFTLVNEIDDGFREGYSFRDLGCSFAGILVGATSLKQKIYADYNEREKQVMIYFVLKFK